MFDVIWTDHNRELVGERRARKGLGKSDKVQDDETLISDDSGFASISTGSISSSLDKSSSSEKSPGFLGSLRLKKSYMFSRNKNAAPTESPTSSPERRAFLPPPSAHSTASTSFYSASSGERLSRSPATVDGRPFIEYLKSPWRSTPVGALRGSGRSSSDEPTTPVTSVVRSSFEGSPNSKTEAVQALGSKSWIAKTTETVFEPKSATSNAHHQLEVAIVADSSNRNAPTPPTSPEPHMLAFFHAPKRLSSTKQCSGSYPLGRSGRTDGVNPIPPPFFQLPQLPMSPPSPKRSRDSVIPPPTQPLKFKAHNPDAWKPPAEWGCRTLSEISPSKIDGSYAQAAAQDENHMSMDLASMQREVRRMASASPEIILVRLNEEWGRAQDPAFYKEMEMEQKRWMLSALHNLDNPRNGVGRTWGSGVGPRDQKILALFESKATASYLAAVYHNSLITHLAPSPLSHELFPNIQPLFSPLLTNSAISVAPSSFNAVHCLSLQSIVPSQGIPTLLHNINRCLVVGGVLHLTVIDPSPAACSLGPRLRHWLEESLLLNVERQFRCMNPSKLFPIWLADARLHAEGSAIASSRFQVANRPIEEGDRAGLSRDEERVRVELRSTVGRTLWKEVWGSFVNGDSWWWEERDIVDECLRLGTYWEYSIIEAVKEA